MAGRRYITHSEIQTFRECPRKHHFQYVEGRVRLAESTKLSFGRVAHEALALWWQHSRQTAIDWIVASERNLSPEDHARLRAMIELYRPPADRYRVLGVEVEKSIPIPGLRGVWYSHKADGILKDKETGECIVLEHKSTTDDIVGYGSYWQRLPNDHQILWYAAANKSHGVAYDVLGKPQIRLRNGETPGEFYQRCLATIEEKRESYYQFRPITLTEDQLAEARIELEQWARQVRFTKYGPRNPSSCRTLYGSCPYLGVCAGNERLNDDTLFRLKQRAHEELEGEGNGSIA